MQYKDLSDEQQKIIDQFVDWIQGGTKIGEASHITLGGYAGTGKTTLLGVLASQLGKHYGNIAFVCYTGKASRVLNQKMSGLHDGFIGTIHSLIYQPVTNERTGEILFWEKRENIDQDLIVVDEASMVGAEIWADLLAYGIPIIAVGDHGQLPPVGEMSFNLMAKPHLKLETIHRQAAENPILKVATMARMDGKIPTQKFGNDVVKYARNSEEAGQIQRTYFKNYNNNTLILCGRNRTRVTVNNMVREALGYSGTPQVGERLICLKNKKTEEFAVYNGMVGTLQKISDHDQHHYWAEIYFEDDNTLFKGRILKPQFGKENTFAWKDAEALNIRPDEIGALFDFGYCLTVHKAQGSQADRVLLFEERNQYQTDDDWKRWLYTAVTRASEKLHIIG